MTSLLWDDKHKHRISLKIFILNIIVFLRTLTLQASISQNSQTHSNNSSAICRRIV